MRDWSADNSGAVIAVVTRDSQFKAACEPGGALVTVDLAEFLSDLQAAQLELARRVDSQPDRGDQPQVGDEDDAPTAGAIERLEAFVREGLKQREDEINAQAKEAFEKLGFYVADVDGDVDEVRVNTIDYDDDVNFLAVDPNDALVELTARFEFEADVTYKVPGTGTYDSEDRVLLFQEERSTTVERSVTREVLVEVAIEEDDIQIANVSVQSSDIEIENPEDDDWPYK